MNLIRRRAPLPRGKAVRKPILTGLALIAGIMLSGCGSTAQMPSAWRAPGVTVDSAARQWKSAFTPIKDTHLFVGMQNDSAYFYLRILAPEEEFRRRISGPGLTVWFEPEDGKKVGVLYPMGTGIHDMEILGADKNDRTLFSPLEVPGVSVRLGSSEGSSMYELKIPLLLSKDHPYAAGAAPGSARAHLNLGIALAEGVDLETGVVGQGRQAGKRGEEARLLGRVRFERIAVLDRVARNAGVVEADQPCGKRAAQVAQLAQLVRRPGRNEQARPSRPVRRGSSPHLRPAC